MVYVAESGFVKLLFGDNFATIEEAEVLEFCVPSDKTLCKGTKDSDISNLWWPDASV